jgi:hypothetical protein
MAQEQTYYQTSIDSCQCGEATHYTVIDKIRIPSSHQDAFGAEKQKCPEVGLILDEIPTDLVQDHQIIERIVRNDNEEHAENINILMIANSVLGSRDCHRAQRSKHLVLSRPNIAASPLQTSPPHPSQKVVPPSRV